MRSLVEDQFLQIVSLKPRTSLLREGEIGQKLFFVEKGYVRAWFARQKTELTITFFGEGDAAASIESILFQQPSPFGLETVSACQVAVLDKANFDVLITQNELFRDQFQQYTLQRLLANSRRLQSFIRDKPQQRYQQLLEQYPQLVQQINQRYLASYLGITPVSLSRIRARRG